MAAKVRVDRETCINSGMCTRIAPEVFELDRDGVLEVLNDEIPEAERGRVDDAAACCPVEAIALVE